VAHEVDAHGVEDRPDLAAGGRAGVDNAPGAP
jgi:hypothetical protein